MKKTIVVTGASKGIGFELVRFLVAQGHIVYALSRDIRALRASEKLHPISVDLSDEESLIKFSEQLNSDQISIDALINNAGSLINQSFSTTTKNDFEGIIYKGVSTDYDWTFFNEYLIAGKVPNFNQKRTRDVLLSKTIVNRLKLKLNDTINVAFFKNKTSKLPSNRKLVITGIYNTGFLEFDKNIMIGDIRQIQRLNRWNENQVGGFEVILENFDDLEQIGVEVYNEIDSTLDATTIASSYPGLFEWIELFDNNTWFIIIIMILVAGINMITALLVLILERIPMVGILKAMGSSNWSIRKIFLYNASYLIFIGLFWGNLIGLTLLFVQKYFGVITLDPSTYYVSEVPVSIDFLAVLFLNIGTLVLCFIMLIIPSIIITKIQPSTSIKFA